MLLEPLEDAVEEALELEVEEALVAERATVVAKMEVRAVSLKPPSGALMSALPEPLEEEVSV